MSLKIIARRLWLALALVAALFTLGACSTTRLAYNQAPNLLYWWLDGYMDFDATQSDQARQDIDAFMAWHRSTELPAYARQLQQWQTLAMQDITPAQACTQFDAVRSALLRASERGLEPLTRLALRLTPEQQAHLQRHQAKSNESFESDFMRGSPEQRLRRQTDLRQTLQVIRHIAGTGETNGSGNGPVAAAALDASRSYLARVMNSPTPGFSAYSQTQVQHGCTQFAALHNATTPEQRTNAMRVLKGYEDDLRALVAQR